MRNLVHRTARTAVAVFLVMSLMVVSSASVANAAEVGFNDEYVFAATRALNESDLNPVAKVPLLPLTVVADIIVLPFTVIAGFVV